MREILPGIHHWTTFHEGIRQRVSSYYVEPAGALIDPMEPAEGVGWFERTGRRPERIVLSNRHHWRDSARFVAAFGCPVLCHEAGLHEFADGRTVRGFRFGDELAPGVTAHEVGAICPEETALRLDAGEGALLFADGVIRGRHGELAFVPDALLGDDPPAVRDGLRAALRRLLDETTFDALLFAHGAPVPIGARSMLLTFVTAPTAGAPPG